MKISRTQDQSNQIVALIIQNDSATLKKVYTTNFSKVKTYILKNNGSIAEAKDIYQEAFVAMWKNVKANKFTAESPTAINGYLFQIAKNKWLDHLRSAAYKNKTFINREIEFYEPETEEIRIKNKQIEKILEAISHLGEKCQLILKLFYFEKKSFKIIAEILSIDEASAKNAKYRCLEQLRKKTESTPNGNR
ncbi:RNA polymerase sigma factor [Aequorivita echinoideorum]|uniref:Sigma-70 family RNA polymerase sigma factor n=1 Tax=Aequorivita echinoideorum TaxID=1549647 RepID=A0ABS5S5Z4_9FLAO|nr:sigma-70 family RNA polymerase sigma factor [Aequorivita echinoideorum]MBT0607240.1 sigma-70 family RNA polymerase sigma factor [Aequorivita echinoideorum]